MAGFESFYPSSANAKLYVTVGSGGFDQLINAANEQLTQSFDLVCQLGQGLAKPQCPHFDFSDDFADYIQQADVVITHGGAGTVFELLEMNKKMVVVPNQFRVDKHQTDLARFVEQHNYGIVCWQLSQLLNCVHQCLAQDHAVYHKEPFFMADELLSFLGVND